jgi:hypothetical protein
MKKTSSLRLFAKEGTHMREVEVVVPAWLPGALADLFLQAMDRFAEPLVLCLPYGQWYYIVGGVPDEAPCSVCSLEILPRPSGMCPLVLLMASADRHGSSRDYAFDRLGHSLVVDWDEPIAMTEVDDIPLAIS